MMLLCIFLFLAETLALDNGLGLTPPMGWNSWNHYRCKINDTIVSATADAIIAKGLDKFGYVYVNIDDCWAKTRDSFGDIVPDPDTFGDMDTLIQEVQYKGLLFGLYSSAGEETCAGRPGSVGFEDWDAKWYAEYKVDYLKYSNCGDSDETGIKYRFRKMRDALNGTGRPIYYSMCEFGSEDPHPATWARSVGNSWRTTVDIQDTFDSMYANINQTEQYWNYSGPGGWNDPDMLEIGNGGMSTAEYEAHFSLWCLMKAPLLIGCDVVNMSDDTLRILTNSEVIAVNQDPMGVSGHRVMQDGHREVWAGPLYNGSVAVVLFNTGDTSTSITAEWKDIFLQQNQSATVRDLWAHKDMGSMSGSVTATVASHGVVMYRITPTK